MLVIIFLLNIISKIAILLGINNIMFNIIKIKSFLENKNEPHNIYNDIAMHINRKITILVEPHNTYPHIFFQALLPNYMDLHLPRHELLRYNLAILYLRFQLSVYLLSIVLFYHKHIDFLTYHI